MGVSFNSFNKEQKLSLESLKNSLLKNSELTPPFELLCYDSCRKCLIMNGNTILSEDFKLVLDENLEVYDLDKMGNINKVDYQNRFIKKDFERVCFEFPIYQNGISKKMLVKNFDTFYIFDSYFKETNTTKDEAKARLEFYDESRFPTNESDYYAN
jgi:hypothetical protein